MTGQDTHLLLRAFADELARCGVRLACTSPGSRCAPLVLSLVREPRLRCFSHLDERCAGFFALGAAKASGAPAAVTCTSGTAAAHLAPAVHEAFEARVPMLVLTADRPPELREVGAGQVIDQVKLYGSAAKWFFEVGTHEATPERLRWMRALACRAVWTAVDGRPGPVHLNFSLREPLTIDEELPADETGRPDGRPWVTTELGRTDPSAAAEQLVPRLRAARLGVVVAGRQERGDEAASAAARFARAAGWPLLADPLSGARRGEAAVAHYDALLRDDAFAGAQVPDLVLRVGDLPTSKPLRAWLAAQRSAEHVALDPERAWQDPASLTGSIVATDPAGALDAARAGVEPADPQWLDGWRDADARAADAIAGALGEDLSEPRVAVELARRLPTTATLFVGSSMPVRDVEAFWPVRDDPPVVLGNRGANGIDGHVSTPFGIAAATEGPVVALIGDVALAHDVGGLLAATRTGLRVVLVVLNNDGGGIFHFLPLAAARDAFEEHVATPHGLDVAKVADLYGCAHERPADVTGLGAALDRALVADRTTIVEVRTDREANLALHRRVDEVVRRALEAR